MPTAELERKKPIENDARTVILVVIVMGVTGAGKTTVGQMLARELGWHFSDADEYHPPENIAKMQAGIALGDQDRAPWLRRLRDAIAGWIADRTNVVLACSALKQSYREELQVATDISFVYLKGSPSLIAERLRTRHGHFTGEQILAGQFADLEEPGDAVVFDISATPIQIVSDIRQRLRLA